MGAVSFFYFDINGTKAGETEQELMTKLKGFGAQTANDSKSAIMLIDGRETEGISFSEEADSQERMIALRDFCNYYGYIIHWNRERKQVEIEI